MPEAADFTTKVQIARVLADGGSMRQAAASAGVNVSTVSRYISNEDEDFLAAQDAVAAYDAANPPEADPDFWPNFMAGARGLPLGTEGPSMNDMIRSAAGRS